MIGGAIGVILGTLRMPALVRAVGLDIRRAVGTNLVVGFVLGLAGFATHAAALDVQLGHPRPRVSRARCREPGSARVRPGG